MLASIIIFVLLADATQRSEPRDRVVQFKTMWTPHEGFYPTAVLERDGPLGFVDQHA